MAPTTVLGGPSEEFTDEQIEQLLQQAEERIRNPSSTALTHAPATKASPLKRKLDESGLPTPYIQTNGVIARADPRRLVEDSTRQQANGIRKVEDPLTVKKRKLEVRYYLTLEQERDVYDEAISQSVLLTRDQGTVMGPPCNL